MTHPKCNRSKALNSRKKTRVMWGSGSRWDLGGTAGGPAAKAGLLLG